MSRKTIFWIVAGVLAAAVVAAVGILSYHAGFDHRGGRVVVGPGGVMRGFGAGAVVVRRDTAFPAFGAFLLLLIGGIVGAAVAYLARPGTPAGAIPAAATQPAPYPGGPQASPIAGNPAPIAGPPVDPRWQQFEEWHRYAHGPANPAGYAPTSPGGTAATVTPAASQPEAGPAPQTEAAPQAEAATDTPAGETPPTAEPATGDEQSSTP